MRVYRKTGNDNMKHSSIVRKLRQVFRTAHDTSSGARDGEEGSRAVLTMLIDAENASPGHMDEVVSRAKRHGNVTRRLAFGSMTDGKWTTARVKHAIRWGSQSRLRTGKNSADIELTITAMDLLHERGVAGFCIVSSDSDFTPLVMRLRESGKLVIGFGEKKSPAAFVEACDYFETVGAIEHGQSARGETAEKPVANRTKKPNAKTTAAKSPATTNTKGNPPISGKARREFLELVTKAATAAKTNDGWFLTSVLGMQIRKIKPNVRYRDYGHRTLIGILKTYPDDIETKRENNTDLLRVKRR